MTDLTTTWGPLILHLLQIMAGAVICFGALRERLRYGVGVMISLVLMGLLLYYYKYLYLTTSILPYMAVAFFLVLRAIDARPLKVLFVFSLICCYLFLISGLWSLLEGWAPPLRLAVTVTALIVTTPPMYLLLARKVWPILCTIEHTQGYYVWLTPAALVLLNLLAFSIHLFPVTPPGLPYAVFYLLIAILTYCGYEMVLRLMQRTDDTLHYEEQFETLDQQLDLQREYYQELTEQINETRRVRHDLRHHFRTVLQMLYDGQSGQAAQYLQGYDQNIAQAEKDALCEHYISNVLLRRFRGQAQELGIPIQMRVALPAQIQVSDVDLCILLSNLMENALAVTGRQQAHPPFVTLSIQTSGLEIRIALDFRFDPALEKQSQFENAPKGANLPAIQTIARKYGGMASFDSRDTVFMISVLLYAPVLEATPTEPEGPEDTD